ncbi:sushi domain-containing protein 1 isoform X1 [Xenopus laevis]|uniref:Sushi domain-containing protein 1 isoform X1 n=1 Tax=Xenopus laevis TaxID=8355 RepID=A0A8J0USF3_XENLA|nr:sushi domain-containing protein 1 isoform X1 [Xenopus laevis]
MSKVSAMTTEGIVLLLVLLFCLVLLLPCHAQLQDDTSPQYVCKKCHTNATCFEKNKTFSCICNYGLIGNGRTHCLDKDECQIGSYKICGNHTACHNTHGSFFCVCLDGYRPSNNHRHFIPNDGTFCTDIDECQSANICGYKGKCKNIPGSYECYCMEGYQLKNGTEPFQANSDKACVDIDECEAEDICGHNAQCKNVPGSHECYCMEGYTLNNGTEPFQASDRMNLCSVVDCGQPPGLPHTQVDLNGNTTFGSQVTYRCDTGFTANLGHTMSICTSHGTWKGASLVCTVIDCGIPPIMPNMLVNSSNNTTFGSNVTYRCMKGYEPVSGNGIARCTQNGRWEAAALSCQVVDCGQPPSIQHASLRLAVNTTLGNTVTYECMSGYVKQTGIGTAVCNENGKWNGADLICKEINCGQPPSVSNAQIILSGSTKIGSEVEYKCLRGFYNPSNRSVSRCTLNGKWEDVNVTCKVNETIIGNVTIFNETCLKWRKSSEITDWKILYKFSIHGKRWHQKRFVQENIFEFITNNSFRCLDLLPGKKYMVIMRAVFAEMQEISINITLETAMRKRFGKITLFNTTCLQWAKSSRQTEEDLEEYNVLIKGNVGNPPKILLNIMFKFSTSSRNPVLCLKLPSEEEYIINVTESSTGLSSSVSLNTSGHASEDINGEAPSGEACLRWKRIIDNNGLQEIYRIYMQEAKGQPNQNPQHLLFNISTDQGTSELCFKTATDKQQQLHVTEAPSSLEYNITEYNITEYNITEYNITEELDPLLPHVQLVLRIGQLPKVSIQKADQHSPYSSYQVFVKHLDPLCSFTCESLEAVTYFHNVSKTRVYITAEFSSSDIPEDLEFSLGDRLYYGEFYNGPLMQEKDYCVILRIISKENKVPACIFVAEIKGYTPLRNHMNIVLPGSVAFVCFIVFLSYSAAWCCKRR